MLELRFSRIEIYDMLEVYNSCTDPVEKARITKLEFLDEYEEWNLIQKHYFVGLSLALSAATEALLKADGEQARGLERLLLQVRLRSQ